MSNEIVAYFKGRTGVAESVYQYDYGKVLTIDGLNLPAVFETHFSNTGDDSSITVIGQNNRVAIPNVCLTKTGIVTAYIYLHTGENDGEVEYVIRFAVTQRARPAYDSTEDERTEWETAASMALAMLQNSRKVNTPLDEYNQVDNGTAGQLLRTKGDGSTEWVDEGLPTDEQTAAAVAAWLDDHPEATTTVEDGSLTAAKFSDDLKLQALHDYITPQMFGAKGDGITDDTDSLRAAIYYSHTNGNILYFPAGKKYYVSGALNYYNEEYYHCTLNIRGCYPAKRGEYSLTQFGGIILADDTDLFKNKDILGNIRNISIVGESRDTDTSIFHLCLAKGLTIYGCNISQVGAVFRDSGLSQCCTIDSNIFLTAYYFAKNETGNWGCIDSLITNNYINGGVELNNNSCFQWIDFNGSTIANNFIDYYHTIYKPTAVSNISFQMGISIGNQYQVFRHLFWFWDDQKITHGVTFNSENDCFNWTKVGSAAHLSDYVPYTYTDQNGDTANYPPSILIDMSGAKQIVIKDAIIQRNVDVADLVTMAGGTTTDYKGAYLKFSCNMSPVNINAINFIHHQGSDNIFYNNGQYKYNLPADIGIVLEVEALPQLSVGWSASFIGQKILYNNVIYTATLVYSNGAWSAKWLDKFGNEAA